MNNNQSLSPHIYLSPRIRSALQTGLPLVALESTVITHGLPYPQNLRLAQDMEREVEKRGAQPATIGVLEGRIVIGLDETQLRTLATDPQVRKISRRDFAAAIVQKANGGTTVAGTMLAAHQAGITVFATGGIGGVHRGAPFDISTDLQALGDTPMIVVCAGAKAILDLPATLEYLETMSVPVIGYQTDEFPAFYSRSSGLPVSQRLDWPQDIAAFARAHWSLGNRSAILVANPIPPHAEIPREKIEPTIQQAVQEAQEKGLRGQAVTPYLLQRLGELSRSHSTEANLALLHHNAQLAAAIAAAWQKTA